MTTLSADMLAVLEFGGWLIVDAFLYGLVMIPIVLACRVIARSASANCRYCAGLMLLLLTLIVPIVCAVTWTSRRHANDTLHDMSTETASATELPSLPPQNVSVGNASNLLQPSAEVAPPPPPVWWLPLIWGFGVLCTTSYVALGFLGTQRLRASALPLSGPLSDWVAKFREECASLGTIPVRLSAKIMTPILVGVFRPVILLPINASGWDLDVLRFVLLHELAHIRRWDNLVNLLQRVAECLLFFQPALWLVSAWVRSEREVCCDEFVVVRTQQPRSYACLLLKFADQQLPQDVMPSFSALASHSVVYRITCLLKKEESMKVSNSRMTLAVAFVILGTVAAIHAATQSGNEKPAPEQQPTELRTVETTDRDQNNDKPSTSDSSFDVVATDRTSRLSLLHEHDLGFTIPGKIHEMAVELGDRVIAGQILAKLDQSLIDAQIKESADRAKSTVFVNYAKQSLAALEHKLAARKRANAKHGLIFAAEEIEQLELGLTLAKAELAKAEEDRKFSLLRLDTLEAEREAYQLRSPVNGTVKKIERREGQAVRNSDTVVTVVSEESLLLTCHAPAPAAKQIKRGMKVRFRAAVASATEGATASQSVYGVVIDNFVEFNAINGTVLVKCRVDNSQGLVHPGMHGIAEFLETR